MDDKELLHRIQSLVDEEHKLLQLSEEANWKAISMLVCKRLR